MITIERITRQNYNLFDDTVKWRMTGVEPTAADREANKGNDFSSGSKTSSILGSTAMAR